MSEMTAVAVRSLGERITSNITRVVIGKPVAIRLVLTALLTGGHVLIEDVPGVGKTLLARALARSIGASFKRIQFTPDLLPGDVTGLEIYNQRTGEFEYRPGPIMAQIVLADEVNRATPKTQSALLESMEEGQVTVGGISHTVPRPFTVVATQNPVEYEGTFPLPEAQLDRFAIRLSLGYPSPEDEMHLLATGALATSTATHHAETHHAETHPSETHPSETHRVETHRVETHRVDLLQTVCDAHEVLTAQRAARAVYVDALVRHYIVALVNETRHHPDVYLGASPRGSLAIYGLAQAHAALEGRDFALPDDVKAVAAAALAHRLILRRGGGGGRTPAEELVQALLDRLPVPGARAADDGVPGRRGKA